MRILSLAVVLALAGSSSVQALNSVSNCNSCCQQTASVLEGAAVAFAESACETGCAGALCSGETESDCNVGAFFLNSPDSETQAIAEEFFCCSSAAGLLFSGSDQSVVLNSCLAALKTTSDDDKKLGQTGIILLVIGAVVVGGIIEVWYFKPQPPGAEPAQEAVPQVIIKEETAPPGQDKIVGTSNSLFESRDETAYSVTKIEA